MSDCCDKNAFDGASPAYKRALIAVIAINAVMFCVEMSAGVLSGSQALKADALDFALALIALAVLGMTVVRVVNGGTPEASTMGLVGALALAANLTSLAILMRWRDGDSNVRSVWLCSRNDAIGNVGVIVAGGLVAATGSAWPDLVVAALLATLFMKSAIAIITQARAELKSVPVCDIPNSEKTS